MLRTVTLFALLVGFGAQNSFADSITVTGGSFIESASTVGTFSITGPSFSLSGTTTSSTGLLSQCVTCEPGGKFKLKGWWEFEGEGEFEGTTYEATGRLRFKSPKIEIPNLDELESWEFTPAFRFMGSVRATDGSASTLRLMGEGLATIRFFRNEDGGVLPSLIRYDFDAAQQTPEPATLALVASGLALVARRRTRRSRP